MRYFRSSGTRRSLCIFLLVMVWVIATGCGGGKRTPSAAKARIYPGKKASAPSAAGKRGKIEAPPSALSSMERELREVSGNRVFKVRDGTAEYIVGPGDVLSITSWRGAQSNTSDIIVRPDGKISYTFLDDLQVSGLTAPEIDSLITERLREFVKRPRIDVLVKEYNSKKVALFGEVAQLPGRTPTGPNVYPLKGRITLLDLLLQAGGQTEEADMSRVELIRGRKRYRINMVRALAGEEAYRGVVLDDGDRIFVPRLREIEEKKVLVLGEVRGPGIYTFKEETTLTDVIAKAGGTTKQAIMDDIYVIRGDLKNPNLLRADLKKMLTEGDLSQNHILRHKDIVYVPQKKLYKFKDWVDAMSPILSFFLQPSAFRDAYTTGGTLLRFDTGVSR